jgi:dihydroorotase-like cyclic amidohydrolase
MGHLNGRAGDADLVIAGGTVVNEHGRSDDAVAVRDGIIVAVGAREAMPPARETIDARGCLVLPGAIDVHVHFRDPGLEHKEDWATGSAAAAAGGVTTVFDMPNTLPPTSTLAAFALKCERAAARSIVNYGIYALLGDDNLDELETLAAAGAIGFKLFMGNTTGNLPCPNDGIILEGFERLAALGLRCTIHAENSPILFHREAALRRAGRTDPLAHLPTSARSKRSIGPRSSPSGPAAASTSRTRARAAVCRSFAPPRRAAST